MYDCIRTFYNISIEIIVFYFFWQKLVIWMLFFQNLTNFDTFIKFHLYGKKKTISVDQISNIFIEYVHPFIAMQHINLILEQINKYLNSWIHSHR
jgi:hypothetical protein